MGESVDEFHRVFGRVPESPRDTFKRFALDCIFDSNARDIILGILAVTGTITQLTSHKGIIALSNVTSKLINRVIMFAAKAATSQVDDLGVYVAAYMSDSVADREVQGGSGAFQSFLESFNSYVSGIVAAAKKKVEDIMGKEAYAAFLEAVYADDGHLADLVSNEFQEADKKQKKKKGKR